MCGIAGFIDGCDQAAAERGLRAMTDALAHRGPDGDGVFVAPADAAGRLVALGHRRLSIIDIAGGAQPMARGDGRWTIVFNGEIYNYVELRAELAAAGERFVGDGDTEVLLAAYARWGEACLPRLRGMFALAIWDAAERTLFLARDAFGKKPLLLREDGPTLSFASEIAALTARSGPGEIEPAAVARYLVYRYVPGDLTFLRGVRHLPPGHCATWRDGALDVRRWYAPPAPEADPARRLAMIPDTVAAFRAELETAVRLRMRADVPVGAFLSGGIDSSAIVALMARLTDKPVRTFSIGFDDKALSELWAARLVAERYKTDHHELVIHPDAMMEQLEPATRRRGAPLSEPADLPLLALAHLASDHVKVVLSGEGSDELLAGYPKHWGDLWLANWRRLAPAGLDRLAGPAARALPFRLRRLGILLRAAGERDFQARQAVWFGLMGAREAAALAPALLAQTAPWIWPEDPGEDADPLQRALRFDKTVWLPNNLLERGDRMTMAASIEGRMPFMDTGLAAFAARLERPAMLKGRVGKRILRAAMAADLPDAILNKPKLGFRVPVGDWLCGPMRDYARDLLLGPDGRAAAWLDRAQLTRLVEEHQSRRRNHEKALWALLALEVFLRQAAAVPAAASARAA